MTRQLNTELSAVTTAALDCSGYSKEMIAYRAEVYKMLAAKITEFCSHFTNTEVVFAGSKGEGVVRVFESDTDLMYIYRNFLCVDIGYTKNGITVIETNSINCPPGYAKLTPLNMASEVYGTEFLNLTTIYDLTNGHILISSTCARNFWNGASRIFANVHDGIRTKLKQAAGPSVPRSIRSDYQSIFSAINSITHELDTVFAMPYFSSTITKKWKARKRYHQWPPHDVIQEVSEMEGFVVPVGASFHEEQNYEWRICYTTGEQKLVSSLSPVQLKVYILLKMFFKKIISPKCDVISSYMIKNIVFWVAERNNARSFTDDKLVDIFLWCLAILRECLHDNRLPNYMIPSRNLLYGKGNAHEKIQLRSILDDYLNEGGSVLLQLEKVRCAISTIERSLTDAISYRDRRNMIEQILLHMLVKCSTVISPATILQPSMMYDALFELSKDRSVLEIACTLCNLLNLTLESCVNDMENTVKLLKDLLS